MIMGHSDWFPLLAAMILAKRLVLFIRGHDTGPQIGLRFVSGYDIGALIGLLCSRP